MLFDCKSGREIFSESLPSFSTPFILTHFSRRLPLAAFDGLQGAHEVHQRGCSRRLGTQGQGRHHLDQNERGELQADREGHAGRWDGPGMGQTHGQKYFLTRVPDRPFESIKIS